jgi:hypothetical protein
MPSTITHGGWRCRHGEPPTRLPASRKSGIAAGTTTTVMWDSAVLNPGQHRQPVPAGDLSRARAGRGDRRPAPPPHHELFRVPSWEEHLRQHRQRQTGTDLHYHDDAAALSDPPPQTDHYLARRRPRVAKARIITPRGHGVPRGSHPATSRPAAALGAAARRAIRPGRPVTTHRLGGSAAGHTGQAQPGHRSSQHGSDAGQ